MNITDIPFSTTDWNSIEPTRHEGEDGYALWRTQSFGSEKNKIRVRLVEYTAGYISDHWCQKGHILFCLEGELETTLEDGRIFILKSGMSYQVADGAEPHRSKTTTGAKLFIVD
jgi:quercetin dioxygenase-like cupin family protein